MWLTWCLYGVRLHLPLCRDLLQQQSCEGLLTATCVSWVVGSASVCLSSSTGWPAQPSSAARPMGPSSWLSALVRGVYWTCVGVGSPAQGSEMSSVVTVEALMVKGGTASAWMGITTSRARVLGCRLDICMYGWFTRWGWCNGCHVSSALGLGLLKLLTPGFELFTVSQKGLVHQGGLVLQADPIPCLMILYCMLQDHNLVSSGLAMVENDCF